MLPALQPRSRGVSTPQKYVPPAQRKRNGSDTSDPPASRLDRAKSDAPPLKRPGSKRLRIHTSAKMAMIPQNNAKNTKSATSQEERMMCLIGCEIQGQLGPKRSGRYYVRWNSPNNFDNVAISAKVVEAELGSEPRVGMRVSCKIVGLGPAHAEWRKQHPYAMAVECCDTRTHAPTRAAPVIRDSSIPQSTCWKRGQARTAGSPVEAAACTSAAAKQNFRVFGANINLVTGEVRQRGRADTCKSWFRSGKRDTSRDRGSTIP